MIRIYLHRCHHRFAGESLLIRSLESLTSFAFTDKSSKADLIITGPEGFYANQQPLSLHHVPFIRNHVISNKMPLQTSDNQVTLFYSPEPPPIGHYRASNCMFGISSELIAGEPSYFRLPYWMEGLDWSDYGIRESTTDRVGARPCSRYLVNERDPSPVLNKPLELAIFTSHMNGLRSDVVNQLREVAPVHGFGPYFNKAIRHHSESSFTKREVLTNYAFNLCPENTIYPGYITEKSFEAYVCGSIPVTVADIVACSLDFNPESMINLYEHYPDMACYFSSILHDKQRLVSIASQPLFVKAPVLDPFLNFLNQTLSLF